MLLPSEEPSKQTSGVYHHVYVEFMGKKRVRAQVQRVDVYLVALDGGLLLLLLLPYGVVLLLKLLQLFLADLLDKQRTCGAHQFDPAPHRI